MNMQELEWLSLHPKEVEKYSGKRVAVTGNGVIASADSVSEVEAILKKDTVKLDRVMLMKVPRKDEEMLVSA